MFELYDGNNLGKALNALNEGIPDNIAEPLRESEKFFLRKVMIAEKYDALFKPSLTG